jgi:hypothetical protein
LTQLDFKSGEHERFRELAAAATCGALTADENAALESHLRACDECRSVFRDYQMLTKGGMAMLAPSYVRREDNEDWNEGAARRRLMDSAKETDELRLEPIASRGLRPSLQRFGWAAALAASLLAGVGIGTWRFGNWRNHLSMSLKDSADASLAKLLPAKKSVEFGLNTEAVILARLQAEDSARGRALDALQSNLQTLQKHERAELAAAQADLESLSRAKAGAETQLSQVALQRDQLQEQLRDARQAYDLAEAELVSLRDARDKSRLQHTSLEARINDLTVLNEEQEKRLKDNEQYLASDRDIRDLMSARSLYIADVFDVDSRSRTRKPFGRVFFTRGKSLLFYAFDLDQQPKLKNANTFQVWGQKETDQSETARPVDLGILYLDSEANRRWFMRFDNPQTLSEIDAVFVTVEPHGGSRKPTGKPFLFATLRKEANHP